MDELLRERARTLANRERQEVDYGTPYLVFLLADERYALPLAGLAGVVRIERLTVVPGCASELTGLLNVRGEIRPIYDLKRLLGRDEEEESWTKSLALLTTLSGLAVGLKVSEVEGLLKVSKVDKRVSSSYSIGRTESGATLLDLHLLEQHPLFKEEAV